MKKNVILLVVDGLSYEMLRNPEDAPSSMPFISSIKNDALWCTEMYSQGPYTEAGTVGLLFGTDSLSNGGYFYSTLRGASIFDTFRENGYETYLTYNGSILPYSETIKGQYHYNVKDSNPYYSRFINAKLSHYVSLYKAGETDATDIAVVGNAIEVFFNVLLVYDSDEALSNEISCCLSPFEPRSGESAKLVEIWKKELAEEHDSFLKDKRTYVQKVLSGEDTFLLKSCNLGGVKYKDSVLQVRTDLAQRNKKLYKRIERENVKRTLIKHPPEGKSFFLNLKNVLIGVRIERKKSLEYFYRIYQCSFSKPTARLLPWDDEQSVSSAKAYAEGLKKWLSRNTDKPSFAYIHFMDFHRPNNFSTHELENMEEAQYEINSIETALSSLPDAYIGNLGFEFSCRYIDKQIESIFKYLKQTNKLKDTICVITADHGSSNFGKKPYRFTNTNNYYEEQYHVPALIYGCGKGTINGFWGLKDLAATILELAGIEKPSSYTGKSMLGNKKNNYALLEYGGTGMPDLRRRPAIIGHRDHKTNCVVALMLDEEPEAGEVLEFYDLNSDPDELTNLADKLSMEDKMSLLEQFKEEHQSLRKNYSQWLKNEIRRFEGDDIRNNCSANN